MECTPVIAVVELPPEVRERVDALTARADALRYKLAAEGLQLAEEALALSRASGYRLGEARALRAATTYRTRQLSLEHALEDATRAAEIFAELGEEAEYAAALADIGRVHVRRGDIGTAAHYHIDALERQIQLGDRAGEAVTRNSLGTVHAIAGDVASALEQYRASADLFDAIGDQSGASLAMLNIGSALGTLGQFREALIYHERALGHYLDVDESVNAILAHNNIGYARAQIGDRDRALSHYQAALQLARDTADGEAEITVLENVGRLHYDKGEDERALEIFRSVLSISEARRATVHQAEAHLRIGQSLARLGRLEEALGALSQALAQTTACGARALVADVHRALVSVYEELGAPEAALRHYKTFHTVREELHGAASERRVLSVMLQAEVREKDRETQFLRERNATLDAANEEKTRLLSRLEIQAAELERLSREDSLTGLRNRRDLDERLPLEWERARRFKHPLTIALADIDSFKRINDTYSHAVGDVVLRTVAQIILDSTRKVDIVARYGGEEIVLMLVETPLDGARTVCESIRKSIELFDWTAIAPGLSVTISIGLAAGDASASAAATMASADAQLYVAKRTGRNRVVA
jgi:diguanylate cyclase (GGDEF)-like protein